MAVALVTGSSSGIGRASALALAGAGFTVYASSRRAEALADLAEAGLRPLTLDVTDEVSMREAVRAVEEEHGAVSVLVNNAGYGLQGSIEQTSMDDARRQFDTNLFGVVRLIQLVLPGMRAQRSGRVVNVGSMGGRLTFPGGGFYHASKHALEAISDALRYEVAPFGVHVSLVQPGPVNTSFVDTAVGTLSDQHGPYTEFQRDLADYYRRAYTDGPYARLNVSAEDVAKVIVQAATARHPRPRYAVGMLARTLMTGRRVLPDQAWDALIRSQYPTPHPEEEAPATPG